MDIDKHEALDSFPPTKCKFLPTLYCISLVDCSVMVMTRLVGSSTYPEDTALTLSRSTAQIIVLRIFEAGSTHTKLSRGVA